MNLYNIIMKDQIMNMLCCMMDSCPNGIILTKKY